MPTYGLGGASPPGKVRGAVRQRGRSHGDEDGLGLGELASPHGCHIGLVHVYSHHFVPQLGQANRGGEAPITSFHNGYFHVLPL